LNYARKIVGFRANWQLAFTVTAPVATFQELVSPLGEAEFRSVLQQRKLTIVRGRQPQKYTSLLNWEMLLALIERGEHEREFNEFRLTRESVTVPASAWLARSALDRRVKVDRAKLDKFMSEGFSLVVDYIGRYVPLVAELCNDIKRNTSERSYATAVVTTGTSGACKLHYDPDLVILQIEGTKRWQIFGPPVFKPVSGMENKPPPEHSPIFDEVLQPGDFLFVPAGNWHHCENGPGRSVHLGIFFVAPAAFDCIRAMTSKVVEEEIFRTPLSRLENPIQLAKLEDEVKTRLIERVNRMNLRDFVSTWPAD
jgi:ribosomal protein L16 Arg81 hydroxylase